jgi:nucleotide-binding universal stress UspA family protein
MTAVLLAVVVVLLIALTVVVVPRLRQRTHGQSEGVEITATRILFPFLAHALSSRALEAALRLARAENATLVPVFLARVPLQLPLDTPLPRQCALAIDMHEAIEQRAAAFGVLVDARIERGRTPRHALRQTIAHERFDRIIIAAATADGPGFGADDAAWLLEHTTGEIIVLRPGQDDQIAVPSPKRSPFRPRRRSRQPRERTGSGGAG